MRGHSDMRTVCSVLDNLRLGNAVILAVILATVIITLDCLVIFVFEHHEVIWGIKVPVPGSALLTQNLRKPTLCAASKGTPRKFRVCRTPISTKHWDRQAPYGRSLITIVAIFSEDCQSEGLGIAVAS